jgi:amidophosphoribosyltransferase
MSNIFWLLKNKNILGKVILLKIPNAIMPTKEVIAIPTPERSLQEKCGVVGLYFPSADRNSQIAVTVQSLIALWHRGQLGAGLTIGDGKQPITHHGKGTPEQAFPQDTIENLSDGGTPHWVIGQTRFGSYGGWNENNLQPMTSFSNNEPITIAHNGQFTAIKEMKELVKESIPNDASDTYIFSRLLAKAEGSSWDEKVMSTLKKVSGSYSLVLGAGDSLYLARDPQGIRPLMLGKIRDGFIAVSETHALDKVGASLIRQIKRGEIVKINKDGVKTIKEGLDGNDNFCDFEWDYFSRPDSSYPLTSEDSGNPEKWKSVYEFREECGRSLAIEHPILNASFVIGVPDSGVPVSIGYADALRLPYRQLIIRDHYDPNGKNRLFQTDYDKNGIQQRVRGKLSIIPSPDIWKDAIVVIGDDSNVRGYTSKSITEMVLGAGAKEVHWIVGFSQVNHPCHLGVSMRTYGELISPNNNGDPKKIAEKIGATSVNYISHEGFIKARLKAGVGLVIPKDEREIFLANGGCGGCLTGLYPISKEGVIYKSRH